MTSWVKPQSQSSQMMISPLTERELDYGKFVDKCHHQFRNPVDRVSRPLDLSSVSRQAKITRGGYIFFYFFIFLFFLFCAQFFFYIFYYNIYYNIITPQYTYLPIVQILQTILRILSY